MKTKHLVTALTLGLMSQAALAAPTVGFDLDSTSVNVGDTFELILRGMDFDMTSDNKVVNNITGGQKFKLQFDPVVVKMLGVQIDPRWTFSSGNKPGTMDNVAGTLTGLAFGTFPATEDDNFNIARISFKALKAGQSEIMISDGEFAAKVNNAAGAKILPSFDSAMVQVVPEPEQWAMLLAGLGLVGLRFRKR
jgi:hypothetical protein